MILPQRHKVTNYLIALVVLSVLAPSWLNVCFGASGRILDPNNNPYYIVSPYDGNDLRDIQYAQLNDVMYLTHADYPPQKLTRLDHASWTIADVNWLRGPFLDENTDEAITITPSATTGTITLIANSSIFDANHVGDLGALWQLTHPVDSNTITGTFTATGYTGVSGGVVVGSAVAEQLSATLAVARGQDFTVLTQGFWIGTLYVQKSYDAGTTWNTVYPYTGAGNNNADYRGTESTDDAIYRLRLVDHLGVYYHREEIYMTFRYTLASVDYNRQGIVRIATFVDANEVTATVLYDLGGTSATYHWAEGAWSTYRGWPRAVCFYQNRLCLAGTAYQPNMFWASQSSDFENMALGSGLANEGIAREIGAAGQNPIMWIKDKKGIVAGTTGAIIRIGTPDSKYVFTPSTVTSERAVETGSCSIQPGLTDNSLIYVDRNRRKVRDLKYDISSDGMISPDLTIFSDDITEPNVLEMAWQKRPDEIGWFVRGDGAMLTLSYNPSQAVMAWTELVTDGNYISVCAIPGVGEDEVWTAVVRDSNDYVMIEKFHKQLWWDEDIWFVDSGLEYPTGALTNTLTGAGHLEGKEVQVYSDANGYIGDFTVTDSNIVLDVNVTQAIAGLGYTATIKTFPIEVSGPLGPSVGMTKNIRLITLCLYESEGGRYGYETMYPILYPTYTTDFFSGLTRLGMDTGYQLEAFLIIDQNEPLPLGVTGIAINKYDLSTDF